MSIVKAGLYVNVGDELGGAEEYVGDSISTFLDNGKLYAATAGFVVLDPKNRLVMVNNHMEHKRKLPRKGDIVIGTAVVVRSTSVGLVIYKINDHLNESGIMVNLHVSNIAKRYIEKIDEAIQKTDIIRAVIVGHSGIEWKVATTAMNTGVIFAQCRYCGSKMNRKSRDQIQCPFCGNTERRVLAPDFGILNETIRYQ